MGAGAKIQTAVRNPSLAARYAWKQTLQGVERRAVFGRNVFDYEWDVCIVLDACRYDLFEEVIAEYPGLDGLEGAERAWSLASATTQWAPRTFRGASDDVLARTAYVTAQGQIDCDAAAGLGTVDDVWEYTSTPTPPELVTERAITYVRDDAYDRVVIHHELPHAPFPHCYGKYDSEYGGEYGTQAVWAGLRTGKFDRDEVWADYKIALERGLEEVERVVEDVEGTVLVTSDHGNLLGEYGFYGHPESMPLPPVRFVPWATVSGEGRREIDGVSRAEASDGELTDLEEHLEALGYR